MCGNINEPYADVERGSRGYPPFFLIKGSCVSVCVYSSASLRDASRVLASLPKSNADTEIANTTRKSQAEGASCRLKCLIDAEVLRGERQFTRRINSIDWKFQPRYHLVHSLTSEILIRDSCAGENALIAQHKYDIAEILQRNVYKI